MQRVMLTQIKQKLFLTRINLISIQDQLKPTWAMKVLNILHSKDVRELFLYIDILEAFIT